MRRHIAGDRVRDRRVLEAMRRVPRHRFVDEELVERAYEDRPLPIGRGQVITQPSLVARMAAAAELSPDGRALEIGTGSGYGAAVLAELAAEVWSVERIPAFAERARRRLEELGYGNVRVRIGDGSRGWEERAPYDAIVVAAGAPSIPPPLLDQLAEGGRLVIPLGPRTGEELYRVAKGPEGVERTGLGPVRFVPLVGREGWEPDEG